MSMGNKVPEIRFKGFCDSWKMIQLGSTAKIKGRLGWKSLKQEEYVSSGPAMIAGKHIKNGVIDWNEVDHIPNWRYLESPEIMLRNNDIIFSKDGSLGNPAVVSNLDVEATINSTMMLVRPYEYLNSRYFYQILNTKYFKGLIKEKVSGSSIPHLFQADMKLFTFPVATPEEQTAIGNTFQKLDSLINQHQQKHDKLSSIKKAMLEKMFPKQGGTIPEIRFKGFSGEWEEKELSELTDYANGKGHEDKQKTSGKYELINLNSISIGGGLKPSGKFIDETNSTLEKNDLVMVLSDVGHGDLLGRVALIPKSNAYVLNQRVALLRPYGNVCPLFLLYNINAHQTYFKKQGAGMSQLNISKGSVESFYSCIPEREEQTAIGNYFQKLDVLIKHHQQQITKLNNIKQACLSKMFV
ncbi:restriction endonuclease subunit S [Shewanella oncorhynchi]|uniref:restriction endonuclease subunit S n=1 Tax=Shewanella oncorhynchi TaxID=2726434 RepID=UPI003D79639A